MIEVYLLLSTSTPRHPDDSPKRRGQVLDSREMRLNLNEKKKSVSSVTGEDLPAGRVEPMQRK